MEWVILAIVVAVVLYGIVTYNGLVSWVSACRRHLPTSMSS
jgi:hypothetical protein